MRTLLIVFLGVFAVISNATGQTKTSPNFKLQPHAAYARGRVLVKAKSSYTGQLSSIGSSGKIKNVAIRSVKPVVKPELAKKGAALRGPLARQPKVDISRYFEIACDPCQNIETFINDLYKTGYFEIVEPVYGYRATLTPNDPQVGRQWYLKTIKAYQAWDITQGSQDITIAIVDTGGDLNHPDLSGNLYHNVNDPINGIDDDNNGFIDDFTGWDFVGADTLNLDNPNFIGDNDPSIKKGGELNHGTWVAGCASASTNNSIGVAGVGFNTKIMFTKQTADNQQLTDSNIYIPYAGMLYAANLGVNIINASWGGPGQSQIIQDLINHITLDLGCLIVAAAGNGGNTVPNYIAAYDNVLSVAATDENDVKASFTTYNTTVDVSAPGVDIFTTQYNDSYTPINQTVNGTSFSTPITSGAAALIWAQNPTFTGLQVGEQLRVTADAQALYAANPGLNNELGYGRLDIQRALTLQLPSIRASNPKFLTAAGLPVLPGQKGFLTLDFKNYLQSTSSGIAIKLSAAGGATVSKGTITPGIIPTNSTISNTLTPFELTISPTIAENATISLLLTYTDGSYSDYQYISFTVNPSYIDVNSNQVITTMTEIGRIGYQDTENSAEGSGFIFNQQSMLFEMGLIMGTDSSHLFNNVRGINGLFDQDFTSTSKITQIIPGLRSTSEIFGEFSNSATASKQAVVVDYRSLVWKDAPDDKFVIIEYKIKNPTTQTINGFRFGIFADWDITEDGANDAANWYPNEKMGYIYSAQASAKPYAGVQLLTGTPDYYAIDNNPAIAGNPFGLYNGFTDREKFITLSTQRLTAGMSSPAGSDVSHVVSAGPYSIAPGQTITLAFALHAAQNLADLETSSANADTLYNHTLRAPVPSVDTVIACYNTPVTLTATGATKYKWYTSFTGGTSFFTGSQYTTSALTHDTTFYVSNADSSFESVRAAAAVVLKANPKITTSGSTTFCDGQSITLSAAQADSYSWSTGETTQTIQVSTADTFTVTVTYAALSCQNTSPPVTTTVNTNPQASFTMAGTLDTGSPITFTNQSTGGSSYFWQFGDGASSTDANTSHTYTSMDNFTVSLTVTAANGCQDISSQVIDVITGLPGEEGVAVYPNPVRQGALVIEITEKTGTAVRLKLVNMLGQSMFEDQFQSTGDAMSRTIPANALSEGIYVLKINVGDKIITRKIVKAQ
jgi:serine protease